MSKDVHTRRGRRSGPSHTREQILQSARHLFATEGYDRTSIRAVAKSAEVDPALVMHFFSSKEGLFQAAIDWPFDLDDSAQAIFGGDPEHLGERLVRVACEIWEHEPLRHPLTVILRNVVERQEAARLMASFVQREILGRLAMHTHDRAASLRGSLVHSTLLGLFMARYVIKVEPLASLPVEDVITSVGPTIQRYLTGEI